MITRFATLTSRMAITLTMMFAIVACGGGGGGGGGGFLGAGGGDGEDTYYLTVELKDPDGNPTSIVSSNSPGTLRVRVTKNGAGGAPIADVIVRASTDSGLLFPSSGSKLTDADGLVTFRVEAGTDRGAGTLVVSVEDDNGVTVEEKVNFQLGVDGLRIGHFVGDDYYDAEIGITPEGAISSEGQAAIEIAVVDENSAIVGSAESVRITSPCLTSGDAILSPENPIATIDGRVSATYTPQGCLGLDPLTAELIGVGSQAFGNVEIASPTGNGLTFVSADPELIVLKGTGGGPNRVENSRVTFMAIDSENKPVEGVEVRFSLTTDVGGIVINPSSAISDAGGLISTIVSSGDVATVVRVVATTDAADGSGEVNVVSDVLTVSTGLPDQNSISVGVVGDFVVEEAMRINGLEREIVVHMADKFNNPVPDGTAAVLTTEYGSIESTCTTVGGECSVTWTSQNPRLPTLESNLPLVKRIDDPDYDCPAHTGSSGPCPADMGSIRGGRSTILVTAIGEESFIDRNGNGIFDKKEADDNLFVNLTEAFIDHNEDGDGTVGINLYDPGATRCQNDDSSLDCRSGSEETFIDFNSNMVFDADGDNPNNGYPNEGVTAMYNGLLCPPEGDLVWCSRELVNVRDSVVLIMGAGPPYFMAVYRGTTRVSSTSFGNTYDVHVSDIYNNRPPAGSDVEIAASGDCEVTVLTDSVVTNTSAAGAFTVRFTQGGVDDPGNDDEDKIEISLLGSSISMPCTPDAAPAEPPDPNGLVLGG